jgi:glutamate-1-semialdehyde 2,1-aminomutase
MRTSFFRQSKDINDVSMWEALTKIIPGGVSSPVRSGCAVGGRVPIVVKGSGSIIEDVSGKTYIDCCMSWGALIHGHAHPEIICAACEAVRGGSSFGMSSIVELELAQIVQRLMPSIQMIRFVSTGTEATMSAARLCRAYTKRNTVIKFQGHYHGHADQFLVSAGSGVSHLPQSSSEGVPSEFVQHTLCLPFNDVVALDRAFAQLPQQIAAVIVEPIVANMGVVMPDSHFLQYLRDLCTSSGSLLIFDEVVTGFRVSRGGAQQLFGIVPDITCCGKIIGGGFPAAAFGGREDVMSLLAPLGGVYQAGTLSGNPVCMKAGATALRLLEQQGFYENLEDLSRTLCDPLIRYIQQHQLPIRIVRAGSMFTIFFYKTASLELDSQMFKEFFYYMLEKGVFFPPAQNEACFLSSAHTLQDVEYIRSCILEFFDEI